MARSIFSHSHWFTFPELLVVVVIVAVVGAYSLTWFSRISEMRPRVELEQRIQSLIQEQERSLARGNISSYSIRFHSGSHGSVVDKDFYGKSIRMSLDFDLTSLTGTLAHTSTTADIWLVHAYLDNRLFKSYSRQQVGSTVELAFSGGAFERAEILSSIGVTDTNQFLIFPWSADEEVFARIKSLPSPSHDGIVLENILGNRKLYWYNATSSGSLDSASIVFEYADEEIPLTLTK